MTFPHQALRITAAQYVLSSIQTRVDDPLLAESEIANTPHAALHRVDLFGPLETSIPGCRHIVSKT